MPAKFVSSSCTYLAVNARLAAADSNGQPNGQQNETLFSRMRIETSVDNAPIYETNRATVEATIEQPPQIIQEDKSKPPTNNSTKSQKSLTLSAGGKRYQNGSKRNATTTLSTNAIATENPNGDTAMARKNQTVVSRWQDSFDDSFDDEGGRSPMVFPRKKHLESLVAGNHIPSSPTMNGDLSGFFSPRTTRRLMPSSKSTQPLLHLGTIGQNGLQQNETSNGHLIQNGNRSPGPFPTPSPTPGSPKQAVKQNGNSGSSKSVERSSAGGGAGLFSHFKNLVNVSMLCLVFAYSSNCFASIYTPSAWFLTQQPTFQTINVASNNAVSFGC